MKTKTSKRRWWVLAIVCSLFPGQAAYSGLSGQGLSGQGLSGQGLSGQGLSGQGLSGQGLSGQGLSGQGLSGQGLSGQGLSGQGLSGQGLSGQGLSGQGLSGQGLSGQGISLLGADLYASDRRGFAIDHIVMRGTNSVDTTTPRAEVTRMPGMSTGDGSYISVNGESAVGHYAIAKMADIKGLPLPDPTCGAGQSCPNPEDIDLYFASEKADPIPNLFHDPSGQDNQDMLYTVFAFLKGSGQWVSMCPYDGKTHMASAIAIAENPQDPTRFILACTASGVDAKCARNWGYRPWASTATWDFSETAQDWVRATVPLLPYYNACKVAARAAYCQDEKSFTKNGTLIDMFDTSQLIWSSPMESPFNPVDFSSRIMMAQEYFVSTDMRAGQTSTSLKSGLQRTRYKELSPQGQCVEFQHIDRLERNAIEDSRWASILENHEIHVFSPTSCTHTELELGKALPWDCSTCTTQVCKEIPGCCGLNGGIWDDSCITKSKQICDQAPDGSISKVWPRDMPAERVSAAGKHLLGPSGAVLSVQGVGANTKVSGWACDPEWSGATVKVQIYGGASRERGGTLLKTIRADQPLAVSLAREVSSVCDGPNRDFARHGFSVTLDALPGGATGNVFVYALDEATTDGPAAPPTLLRNGIAHVPTCSHPETVGDPASLPLPVGCSSCTTSVCASLPYCCNQGPWDDACAAKASEICTPAMSSTPANSRAFASIATGWIEPPVNGTYGFKASGPSRLWVNGKKLIDFGPWQRDASTDPAIDPSLPPTPITLQAGTRYHIRWDRLQTEPSPDPDATTGLIWCTPGGGPGLPLPCAAIPSTRLYSVAAGGGTGLDVEYQAGAQVFNRVDPAVDVNPPVGPPTEPRIDFPLNFQTMITSLGGAATWQGELVPSFTEDHVFELVGTGSPELFTIDGQTVTFPNGAGFGGAGDTTAMRGTCAHNLCTTGAMLRAGSQTQAACHPCLDRICNPGADGAPAIDSFCCDGGNQTYYSIEPAWDAKCIAEVNAYCSDLGTCPMPEVAGPTTRTSTAVPLKAGVHYAIRLRYRLSPTQVPTVRLSWQSPRQLKQVIPTYALYPRLATSTAAGSGLNVTLYGLKSSPSGLVPDLGTAIASGVTPFLSTTVAAGQQGTPFVNVLELPVNANPSAGGNPVAWLMPPPIVISPRYGEEVFSSNAASSNVTVRGLGVPGATVRAYRAGGGNSIANAVPTTVDADGRFVVTLPLPGFGDYTVALRQDESSDITWPIRVADAASPTHPIEIYSPRDPTHAAEPNKFDFPVSGLGEPGQPVAVTDLNTYASATLLGGIVAADDGTFKGTVHLSGATLSNPYGSWHKLVFSQGGATDGNAASKPVFVSVGFEPPTITFPRTAAQRGLEPDCSPGGAATGWNGRIDGTTPYPIDQFPIYIAEETGGAAVRFPTGFMVLPAGDQFHFSIATTFNQDFGAHVVYAFQAPPLPGTPTAAELDAHLRTFASVAAQSPKSRVEVKVPPPRFDIPGGAAIFYNDNGSDLGDLLPGVSVGSFYTGPFDMVLPPTNCQGVQGVLCAQPYADVLLRVGSRTFRGRASSSGSWTIKNVELVPGWSTLALSQVAASAGGAWSEGCPSNPIETSVDTEDGGDVYVTAPDDIAVDATSAAGTPVTFQATASYNTPTGFTSVPVVCSHASGETFPIGKTSVTCTAHVEGTNAYGTAVFHVTVRDVGPVIHAPTLVTVEATDAMGAVATYHVTADDFLDGPLAVDCVPSSPTRFGLDPRDRAAGKDVFCTTTDSNGHMAVTSFNVSVVDTTPPTLTLPAPIDVDAGTGGTAIVSFAATSHDLVSGNVPVVCLPAAGSTLPIGVRTVACTATDQAGNVASGTFTVTVKQAAKPNTMPVVTPPTSQVLEATGPSGAVATFAATATDAEDGALTPTCTPPSGSVFPLGVVSVTCTARDSANATGSATFAVTVRDTTPPALTLPAPMTVTAGAGGTAVVTFATAATDLVSGVVQVTCLPASGSTFSVGTNTVNCSARDAANNTRAGAFTVTVRSANTAPVVKVPANITVEATGVTGARVTFSATATDAQDGALTPTCAPASGSTFAIGTTTVTCTAKDSGGLTGSASFKITVSDGCGPKFSNVPGTIIAYATSKAGAKVTYTKPTASDAVDGARTVTCTPASGTQFPVNKTTVTCTASDTRGNATTAKFAVWVQYQAPTDGTFFLVPIRSNGSSIFKIGRPVPARFKLTGASAGVTDLVAKFTVTKISNTVQGTVLDSSDETVDDTDLLFKYRPLLKFYAYRWRTRDQTQGTFQLKADLGDGVTHQINVSLKP